MNEPAFAGRVCRVLDAGLDQLPDHITERLAAARGAALARLPNPEPAGRPASPARMPARRADERPAPTDDAPWLRWVPVPLAATVLLGGLLGIWHWSDMRRAQDLAALDVAILADDLPLSAYADKGFGVYLHNTGR
jgi:hypothetical protein